MKLIRDRRHLSWRLLGGILLGLLTVGACNGGATTSTESEVVPTGEATTTGGPETTTSDPVEINTTTPEPTTAVASEPEPPANGLPQQDPKVEQCGDSRQSDWLCVITPRVLSAPPDQAQYQFVEGTDAKALESLTWVFISELGLVNASFKDESDCYLGFGQNRPTELLSRSQGGLFLIRLGEAYCQVVGSGRIYVYDCGIDRCPLSVRFEEASGKLTVRETQARIENPPWSEGVLEIFVESQPEPELMLEPGDVAIYSREEGTVERE